MNYYDSPEAIALAQDILMQIAIGNKSVDYIEGYLEALVTKYNKDHPAPELNDEEIPY